MERRVFKKTGEEISLLGFGCMRFPKLNQDGSDIDERLAEEMLDYAYSNGVNYFDTAYPYHEGKSEAFTGRALAKYPRESYKLATKMPVWLLKQEGDAPRYFEEQLERCQVDYFDFYLVHALSAERIELMERVKLYDYLLKEKERGRIRNLGFSFHDTPDLLESLVSKYSWDMAQLQLNYLDWELQDAKRSYGIMTRNNIPVIVMEPVHGGTLANLPQKSMDILSEAAPDASAASWALRFAASLPNVMTILSGMSSLEQVADNINTIAGFKPLAEDEYRLLERALVEYKKSGAIPCTSCAYCMDCPAGVDIPRNFANYNQYKFNNSDIYLEISNQTMGEGRHASFCVECGKCAPLCPQFIKIPEELKKVAVAVKEATKGD